MGSDRRNINETATTTMCQNFTNTRRMPVYRQLAFPPRAPGTPAAIFQHRPRCFGSSSPNSSSTNSAQKQRYIKKLVNGTIINVPDLVEKTEMHDNVPHFNNPPHQQHSEVTNFLSPPTTVIDTRLSVLTPPSPRTMDNRTPSTLFSSDIAMTSPSTNLTSINIPNFHIPPSPPITPFQDSKICVHLKRTADD